MYVFSVGDMQAEHCQKELEICRNDLTTCLEASAQVQRLTTPSQLLKHDHFLAPTSRLLCSGKVVYWDFQFCSYVSVCIGCRQLNETETLVGQLTLQCAELQKELVLLKVICRP
jgi:hypothetical protein